MRNESVGQPNYTSFDGIVLTDTFQLSETKEGEIQYEELLKKNSDRVEKQKKAPLRIIMGNPPYSIGQKNANDNAQNQSYEKLEKRIEDTYIKRAAGTGKSALYDSYIKAFRWSSDRLDRNGGIICFVSNSSWIDSNAAIGFRKCIEEEFTSIYVLNLRGNQRTKGELSRKEGGKIFGSGSRTPISITLLVRNPNKISNKATLFYHDIGDYLSREEKLGKLREYKSLLNNNINLKQIIANGAGDWISQRNNIFDDLIQLFPSDNFNIKSESFFTVKSSGIGSGRDAWVYNFSVQSLKQKINETISFYNQERERFFAEKLTNPNVTFEAFIEFDSKKITWDTRRLKGGLIKNKKITFQVKDIRKAIYRPFCKINHYFNFDLNHSLFYQPSLFPSNKENNIIIGISCIGTNQVFSTIISNLVADVHLAGDTQCLPLYNYEENKAAQKGLFDGDENQKYTRRDAISDFILERAKKQYGKTVTKEDIFYYVYGFLHNKDYRETFANDLKKMLPRLPLIEEVKDFWAFSKAGRKLAELHLNYETIAPYPEVTVSGDDGKTYTVDKMRFPKKNQKETINYNSKITVSNIPAKAYEYVINGKSAIEWVMERYQVTTHKESGITNDPNDWSKEVGNPRYILDLLLSIINVSVQTVDIVSSLPKVKFE
jgi:predicted helicase